MNITNDVTPTTKASPITSLLVDLGKILSKNPRNVEWLDVEQVSRICKDHELKVDNQLLTTDDLEAALRQLFEKSDELCFEGISVTGYCRRVKWDLVFVLRFYPDPHFQQISFVNKVEPVPPTKDMKLVEAN